MSRTELVFYGIKFINDKRDDIMAFIWGDAVLGLLVIHFSFFDSAVKVLGIGVSAIIAGLFSVIGKSIGVAIEKWYLKTYKKLKRKWREKSPTQE